MEQGLMPVMLLPHIGLFSTLRLRLHTVKHWKLSRQYMRWIAIQSFFELSSHDVLFPAYLAIGILPEEVIEANGSLAKKPIGSGAFRFKGWPQPGKLLLTRVADLQPLVFEKVADPTMRVLKLLRGEIDLLQNDLPTELIELLTQKSSINVQHTEGSNFTYLGFNLEDETTTALAVRQAISLAIDRNEIIQHIFSNGARKASSLLPASHWAGGKGLPLISRDLAAARKLLSGAGFGRKTHSSSNTKHLAIHSGFVLPLSCNNNWRMQASRLKSRAMTGALSTAI